jgi:hypothetical protein
MALKKTEIRIKKAAIFFVLLQPNKGIVKC